MKTTFHLLVEYDDGEFVYHLEQDQSEYGSRSAMFHSFVFMFTEGNYSCECNVYNFLARAKGEDDPDRSCKDIVPNKLSVCTSDGKIVLWTKENGEIHGKT